MLQRNTVQNFCKIVNSIGYQLEILEKTKIKISEFESFEPYAVWQRINRECTPFIIPEQIFLFLQENGDQHTTLEDCELYIQCFNHESLQMEYQDFAHSIIPQLDNIRRCYITQKETYKVDKDERLDFELEGLLGQIFRQTISIKKDINIQTQILRRDKQFSVQKLFEIIDIYKDDNLNLDNLGNLLLNNNQEYNENQIMLFLKFLDKGNKGEVDFYDFGEFFDVEIVNQPQQKSNQIKKTKKNKTKNFQKLNKQNVSQFYYLSPEKKSNKNQHNLEKSQISQKFASPTKKNLTLYKSIQNSQNKSQNIVSKDNLTFEKSFYDSQINFNLSQSKTNFDKSILKSPKSFIKSNKQQINDKSLQRQLSPKSISEQTLNQQYLKKVKQMPQKFQNNDNSNTNQEIELPHQNFQNKIEFQEVQNLLHLMQIGDQKADFLRKQLFHRKDFSLIDIFKYFDAKQQNELKFKDFAKKIRNFEVEASDQAIQLFFKKYDTNKNKSLTFGQFSKMFIPIQEKLSVVKQKLNECDSNKFTIPNHVNQLFSIETKVIVRNLLQKMIDNESNFEELRVGIFQQKQYNLKNVFNMIDSNKDGIITQSDLQKMLKYFTVKELEILYHRLDRKLSGEVNYKDFIMEISPSLFEIV